VLSAFECEAGLILLDFQNFGEVGSVGVVVAFEIVG